MTELTFTQALDAVTDVDGTLTAPVPDNWMQGRTTYGGYSAALLLEAALRRFPDLPPLRSALINFVGPMGADTTLSATRVRQGRNVTTIETRAGIAGQTVTTGSFVFGTAQDSAITVAVPGPDAPPPDACEPYIPAIGAALAPRFHHNFDLLLIEGDRPLSGSDRGYLRFWVRHRDVAAHGSLPGLLAIGDALPPAVFPLFKRLGANSSMTWICNFLAEAPETTDGWWQMESYATGAAGGYSSQHMRVWNSDGALVLDGMQSVLVFV